MKIAILSFYGGINLRGVERWVFEMASRLCETEEVTVFQNKKTLSFKKFEIFAASIDYDPKKRTDNKILKRLFVDYDSLKVLEFDFKILKRLLKGKFDIIIPTDGGWEPAIVRVLTWMQRVKMVIVGHAGIGFDDANNLWSFPDVFVALSSHAKAWAKRINPFVRVEHIPNGVDLKKFNMSIKKKDLKLIKPVALCVSALEKGKRIELIIKAVSKIKGLSLLICGKGELKDELGSLGNKLLKNRFRIEEFSFDEMPSVYLACDIFLSASLPSYSFEMVLPEALSCGLPVVANNDPIRREIVGDGGLLVNPQDVNEYSSAIKNVLGRNWGSKPVEQAKKFSWDSVYGKYQRLFNSLTGS